MREDVIWRIGSRVEVAGGLNDFPNKKVSAQDWDVDEPLLLGDSRWMRTDGHEIVWLNVIKPGRIRRDKQAPLRGRQFRRRITVPMAFIRQRYVKTTRDELDMDAAAWATERPNRVTYSL